MFNSNLAEFVTGRRDGVYRAGSDGALRLTLPELLGVGGIKLGGNYGTGGATLSSVLEANFRQNWAQIAMGVIFIPVAANVAMKLIRKPVILPANRMLKSLNLGVKI